MDCTYAEKGVRVILWKNNPHLWTIHRDVYLGKRTRITHISDDQIQCMVSCDSGLYIWYTSEMILASDVPLLRESDRELLK